MQMKYLNMRYLHFLLLDITVICSLWFWSIPRSSQFKDVALKALPKLA